MILTTTRRKNKFGNQFLYQAGFGKNIAYESGKWLLLWMLEFDGLYVQKSKVNDVLDQNSGGNLIIIGPSLWFSTQHFILQAGIAPVVHERLFGVQSKNHVYISFNLGWKFNY